jgi:transposase
MTKNRGKSGHGKPHLKRLGNPYASLQDAGDVGQEALTVTSRLSHDVQEPYVRHPYAFASMEADGIPIAAVAVRPPTAFIVGTASKAEFRAKCRRIFEQYIPALEKGRLREHHRDFILRNESRSAATRYLLLRGLEKYDLSTVPGLRAHFNRERESLTAEKLKQIERMVDRED